MSTTQAPTNVGITGRKGEMLTTPRQKAKAFNVEFSALCRRRLSPPAESTRLAAVVRSGSVILQSLWKNALLPFPMAELEASIADQGSMAAAGEDGIHPQMLKNVDFRMRSCLLAVFWAS